jgi:putative endonuclease
MNLTETSAKTALARKGEELACQHLIAKGYQVLHRNYRIGQGELDIIARHQGMVVFVEVKTRESDFLTDPLQLVPMAKQKQVIRLANTFLKMQKTLEQGRFDVVIVVHNMQYTKLNHIEDAFYPMV